MKTMFIIAAALLLSAPALFAQTKAGKQDTTRHASYYTCPMHPDVFVDKPGKCPRCGMNLKLSTKEEMKSRVSKSSSCPVQVKQGEVASVCPACARLQKFSAKEQMKAEVVRLYTCPMVREKRNNGTGKCSKCGMPLATIQ